MVFALGLIGGIKSSAMMKRFGRFVGLIVLNAPTFIV